MRPHGLGFWPAIRRARVRETSGCPAGIVHRCVGPCGVYNSARDGADLAPEDLVDEWSDLSDQLARAPARASAATSFCCPSRTAGMARVWAARHARPAGLLQDSSPSRRSSRTWRTTRSSSGCSSTRRASRPASTTRTSAEIYELGEEGHVLYLAMEWVNGDSLDPRGARHGAARRPAPIDPRIAARIVADACAGLHAAHELTDDDGRPLNVVHRDVSPHNILVSLEGTVKVTDFGVAKALGQSHQATVAGQVKGKVCVHGARAYRRRRLRPARRRLRHGLRALRGPDGACSRSAAATIRRSMQAVLRGHVRSAGDAREDRPAGAGRHHRSRAGSRAAHALRHGRADARGARGVAGQERVASDLHAHRQPRAAAPGAVARSSERAREGGDGVAAARRSDDPASVGAHAGAKPQAGQSHSGVVSTGAGQPAMPASDPMRARAPSIPEASPAAKVSAAHGRAAAAAASTGTYGAAAHRVARSRRVRATSWPRCPASCSRWSSAGSAGHLDVDALARRPTSRRPPRRTAHPPAPVAVPVPASAPPPATTVTAPAAPPVAAASKPLRGLPDPRTIDVNDLPDGQARVALGAGGSCGCRPRASLRHRAASGAARESLLRYARRR